jgi:hypothetical protein
MSYIIDIGGAPANEDCAQLGQTPDFEAVNTFEVLAYKLAIIARHGMPPAGCKLGPHTNRHDFGVYRTPVSGVGVLIIAALEGYGETKAAPVSFADFRLFKTHVLRHASCL